ncbi:hypothetical protein B0T21DRAFT_411724 [Apiosordaria backusii]|uniref:Uncharacterized protein n=1 Tax=Apiosordaria backusii TaxID=314023 RepID=A0AA40BLQ5_9PEZI|nr:hypothetical protein B0T21DRAFT_411724 [Apiosordaria backusii]
MAHLRQETRRQLMKRAALPNGQLSYVFIVATSFQPLLDIDMGYNEREAMVAQIMGLFRNRDILGPTFEDLMESEATIAGFWSQEDRLTSVFQTIEYCVLPDGIWQKTIPKDALLQIFSCANGRLHYTVSNVKKEAITRVYQDPVFLRIHISIKAGAQAHFHGDLCGFELRAYGGQRHCYYRCIAVVKLRQQHNKPDLIRLFSKSRKIFYPSGRLKLPATYDWDVDDEAEYLYVYIQATEAQYRQRCPTPADENMHLPLDTVHDINIYGVELCLRAMGVGPAVPDLCAERSRVESVEPDLPPRAEPSPPALPRDVHLLELAGDQSSWFMGANSRDNPSCAIWACTMPPDSNLSHLVQESGWEWGAEQRVRDWTAPPNSNLSQLEAGPAFDWSTEQRDRASTILPDSNLSELEEEPACYSSVEKRTRTSTIPPDSNLSELEEEQASHDSVAGKYVRGSSDEPL